MARPRSIWSTLFHRHPVETDEQSAPCQTDSPPLSNRWGRGINAIARPVRTYVSFVLARIRRARLARIELWQEATQQDEKIRTERRARRRALSLLVKLLNPEQFQEFRIYKHFHVTGASSGVRYRIRMETVANIDVLDDYGKISHRLCVHPAIDVPQYDVMASQLLQLQDPICEKRLLKQAKLLSK